MALGREDGKFALYGEELGEFVKVQETSGLAEALANPIYPAEKRGRVLAEVLAKMALSKIMQNFISLLQDKGRIGHVAAINDYYQLLVDEVNNLQRATITTASAISEDMRDRIKSGLEKMTGKQVILEMVTDPEIIGGIVTRVGDLTMDGSVITQLKNLKESLIKG
jgi:F-type H+-transporting ATPase subunit delta